MRRIYLVMVSVTIVCLLSGCGGGAEDPAAGGATTAPGGGTVATPGGGETAGGETAGGEGAGGEGAAGFDGDVCTLLTQEEAGEAIGGPVGAPQPAPDGRTCMYQGDTGFVQLGTGPQSDYDVLKGASEQTGGGPLSGLGEEAFFAPPFGAIIDVGDYHIQVFVSPTGSMEADEEASVATATTIVGRL